MDTPGPVAQGGGLLGNLREGEGPPRCARLPSSRAARGSQAGRLGSASALGPAPPLRARVSPQGVRPVGGTGARGPLSRAASSGVGWCSRRPTRTTPAPGAPARVLPWPVAVPGAPLGGPSLQPPRCVPVASAPSTPGLLSSLHLPAQFSSVPSLGLFSRCEGFYFHTSVIGAIC